MILTSAYDAASNRTKLSATVGGTADFENNYLFDDMNRMTQVEQIGQGGGNTVASKRANFAYNALSQFTSVERRVKPSSTWNEVATTVFSYDTLNRVTDIAHQQSSTDLFTPYSYAYDYMDRITGITSQDGTVAYTYDKTSQLTGADYDYQTDETFAWDANGNPTGGSNSVSANNHLDSDGTYNYAYDDEGNLILRTKISDSSYTEYTWDYRNRLTNVTDKTSGGTATMTADYTYDVYDRRISKVVDPDGAGATGSTTTRYVYEDEGITRVVLQFGGSNNQTHRYLHGPAVDQLLADEDSGNDILWSLTDHLGTVRDLINNSAVTQNHITYDAFGSVTSESASAVDFLMGFAGMDRDEESGASYSWHRSAQAVRWLSEDPSTFAGNDLNLHRYVSNEPVQNIDPSGLVSQLPSPSDIWETMQWSTNQEFVPVELLFVAVPRPTEPDAEEAREGVGVGNGSGIPRPTEPDAEERRNGIGVGDGSGIPRPTQLSVEEARAGIIAITVVTDLFPGGPLPLPPQFFLSPIFDSPFFPSPFFDSPFFPSTIFPSPFFIFSPPFPERTLP